MALRKLCESQRIPTSTTTTTVTSEGYGPSRDVTRLSRGDNRAPYIRGANVKPQLVMTTSQYVTRYRVIKPMLFPMTPIFLDFSPTEPVNLGVNEIGKEFRVEPVPGFEVPENLLRKEKRQLNLHLTNIFEMEDIRNFHPHLRYVMPKPVIVITDDNQTFGWFVSFKESVRLLWDLSNLMNVTPGIEQEEDFCKKWNEARKTALIAFDSFTGAVQQYFMQILSMPEYFVIEKDNSFSKFIGEKGQPYHIILKVRQRQERLLAQFGYNRSGKIRKKAVSLGTGLAAAYMGKQCNNQFGGITFNVSHLKHQYNKKAAKYGESKMRKMIKVYNNETKIGYLLRLKDYGIAGRALNELIQEEMDFQEYRTKKEEQKKKNEPIKQMNGIKMFLKKESNSNENSNNSNVNKSEAVEMKDQNEEFFGASISMDLDPLYQAVAGPLSGTMMDWDELNTNNTAVMESAQAGAKEVVKSEAEVKKEQMVPKLESETQQLDEQLEKEIIKIVNSDNELQPRSNEMVVERTQTIMTPISAVQAPNLRNAVNIIDMMDDQDRGQLQAIFAKHGSSLEAAGLMANAANQGQQAAASAASGQAAVAPAAGAAAQV